MFTFEVRFIWAARWNLTKCLYLLTRYLQFLLVGALIYQSTVVLLSQLSKSPTQSIQPEVLYHRHIASNRKDS